MISIFCAFKVFRATILSVLCNNFECFHIMLNALCEISLCFSNHTWNVRFQNMINVLCNNSKCFQYLCFQRVMCSNSKCFALCFECYSVFCNNFECFHRVLNVLCNNSLCFLNHCFI